MDTGTGVGAAFGAVFFIQLVVGLLVAAFMFWRVFEKAGQPGWASLIPIYNLFVLAEVAGKEMWWGILMLIPVVNIVIALLICLGVAEKFGQGAGFGIGLFFLGIIFFPILGFGNYEYTG